MILKVCCQLSAFLSKCGPGISSTCEADTDESARVDLDELKSSPSPCLNISQNKVAAFCASPAQSAISHQAGVFATSVVNVWGNAQRDWSAPRNDYFCRFSTWHSNNSQNALVNE